MSEEGHGGERWGQQPDASRLLVNHEKGGNRKQEGKEKPVLSLATKYLVQSQIMGRNKVGTEARLRGKHGH